jgi:hypothetical protein
LGALLRDISDFPLRRVGSGNRMTLTHHGEQWLDQWLEDNARVSWIEDPEPWVLEANLLSRVSLPLNLQGNEHHPFHPELTRMRAHAKFEARNSPVAHEGNQQRAAGPPNIAG